MPTSTQLLRSIVFATVLVTGCRGGAADDVPVVPVAEVRTKDAWKHRLSEPRPIRAERAGVFDRVVLRVTVGLDGRVVAVKHHDGPRRWSREAQAEVKSWTYRPFLVDGRPVPIHYLEYIQILPPEDLPKFHVLFPSADPATAIVTLRRAVCFGTCPAYVVTISGDGTVTYQGQMFVSVTGPLRYRISTQLTHDLIQSFRSADFFSMKPAYRLDATDLPTTTVSIQLGNQSKQVVDYGGSRVGMPQAVTDLERLIERGAGIERWVNADARTLDELEALGWDFRSRAAGESLVGSMVHATDEYILGLIERGAPLDMTVMGMTALEAAAWRGRAAAVSALIRAGAADALSADKKDQALRNAAGSGSVATLREFMKARPDVNASDRNGDTALMSATGSSKFGQTPGERADQAEAVRLLLAAGADPSLKNNRGESALHAASSAEVVTLLLGRGAELESRSESGATPLLAVYHEEAALALIDAGADTKARSASGETLSKRAKEFGWKRVRARLKR